jgi:hypothetical protein
VAGPRRRLLVHLGVVVPQFRDRLMTWEQAISRAARAVHVISNVDCLLALKHPSGAGKPRPRMAQVRRRRPIKSTISPLGATANIKSPGNKNKKVPKKADAMCYRSTFTFSSPCCHLRQGRKRSLRTGATTIIYIRIEYGGAWAERLGGETGLRPPLEKVQILFYAYFAPDVSY